MLEIILKSQGIFTKAKIMNSIEDSLSATLKSKSEEFSYDDVINEDDYCSSKMLALSFIKNNP